MNTNKVQQKIIEEIEKSKLQLRSPANRAPIDQGWVQGHINGLKLALTYLQQAE